MTRKKPTGKSSSKASEAPAPATTEKAAVASSANKTGKKRASKKAAAKKAVPRRQNSADASSVNSVAQPAQSTREPYTSNSGGKFALAASLLALVLAVYAVYQTTLSTGVTSVQVAGMGDRLNLIASEQQGQKQGLDSHKTASEENINQIDQRLGALQSTVSGLEIAAQESIDDIKANLGESVARWKLDELHSLLTRVNRIYQLTGEQGQAIKGLKLAQSSLATIDNPRLADVNTALAEDILRVKADRSVDIVSINDRLVSMSALIPDLVLAEDARAAEAEPEVVDETQAEQAQDAGLLAAGKSLMSDIGSLVKHKDLDAPLQPSLDEHARFVVYESLRLQIHAAMVASLRRDNAIYQAQLALTDETLTRFFDAEQAATQAMHDQLQVLQSYDVRLSAQAITLALTALNRVMVVEN